MYISDDEVSNGISAQAPFCADYPARECAHCQELAWMVDLREARKELAELRAWREQVFLVVRQLESTLAEHHRIVESLKK